MRAPFAALLWLAALPALAIEHHLLIATGLGGDDSYREQFTRHALQLRDAALAAGVARERIVWLDATPQEAPHLQEVVAGIGVPALRAHEVTDRVNNVRNDGPELLEPGVVPLDDEPAEPTSRDG